MLENLNVRGLVKNHNLAQRVRADRRLRTLSRSGLASQDSAAEQRTTGEALLPALSAMLAGVYLENG